MQYRQPYATGTDLRSESTDAVDLDQENGMVAAWIVAAIAFYLVIVVAWAIAHATGLI